MLSLPTLAKSLAKHLKDVEKRIKEQPPPCSEAPQHTLFGLCDEFADKIRKCTEGAQGFEGFFQSIMEDFEVLKTKLYETHPKFILGEQSETARTTETTPEKTQDSEEDLQPGIPLPLRNQNILTF